MRPLLGSNTFKTSLLSLAVIASMSSISAYAQTVNQDIERLVVTATQTPHSELTAPASVSIVTAEDIARLAVADIGEAIRATTGVNVLPAAAYGREDISIRGMDGSYTLILINGRRVNSQDALIRGNDFDLSTIPMSSVQRIEIVRGPMSSLYGSEALGGVVNVILKQPKEKLSGNLNLQKESITTGTGGDQSKLNLFVSGQLSESVSATLIAEKVERDAWRTDDVPVLDALEDRSAVNVMTMVNWTLADNQALNIEVNYSDDERKADWQRGPRLEKTNQTTERFNFSVSHDAQWELADTQVRYYHENVDLNDASTAYTTGEIKQTNSTLDGKASALLAEHLITAGVEFRNSEVENERDLTSGKIDYSQSALYLQDEFNIGKLALTLGGRLDDHDVFGAEFSPRAYAVYNVSDEFVIKAGAGKAFKAPGMLEMSNEFQLISCRGACWLRGNPELNPETSVSYELSAVYQAQNFGVNFTIFNNDVEDKIERDITTAVDMNEGVPVISYINISESKIQGAELSSWYDINDAVSVDANFAYTDAKDKSSDEVLQGTPKQNANVTVNWQVTQSAYTFAQWQYIGEQKIRSTTVDAYSLFNLGAGYEFSETFGLRAGISNLSDESFDDEVAQYGYVEKGRSVFANFSMRF